MHNAIFVLEGILIPLLGTTLGAAAVFFWTRALSPALTRVLFGLAAGVMLAASFYSLLQPAAEMASAAGTPPVLPALVGTLSGAGLFWAADLYLDRRAKADRKKTGRLWSMLLAVTLHNLPEGMAVGVILAGAVEGGVSKAAAMALALGIAIQNFPEGAIVSLPLAGTGQTRGKSFLLGFLSGAVEPAGAFLTLIFTACLTPILPYVLCFAAGAMIYVVASELIPELGDGTEGRTAGNAALIAGFALMMALDLSLG